VSTAQNSQHDRQPLAPPIHPGPGVQSSSRSHPGTHHHREIRDHPLSMESDRPFQEHNRSHDNPRFAPVHDGRSAPVLAPMGPNVDPPPRMSAMHSPPVRRASGGSRHESLRQPSHLPHLPPVQHMEPSGGYSHSRSFTSPPMHHSHPSLSSLERTRSQSSLTRSRGRHSNAQPYPGYSHPYPEGLPPMQHVMHSPPIPERERPRHDLHELVGQHGDHHGHRRHPAPIPHHSPPLHPLETRSSSRVHSQHVHREEQHHYERQRDLDREREQEWERERERERERGRERRDLGRGRELNMLSPEMVHNSRQPIDREDYQEHHIPSRMREDQAYYHDAPAPGAYSMPSRSGTPGSGSGSGSGIGAGEGPSRPDSRTQYYDHDRTRAYRLRPVNQPNEDMDLVHEDGRSASRDRGGGGGGNFPLPEQSRPSMESRKRVHNEMEIDSDNDVGDGPPGHAYPSGRIPEDRGSKRYLRESRRSVENQEENRMGP
jgi:hypothetical protein